MLTNPLAPGSWGIWLDDTLPGFQVDILNSPTRHLILVWRQEGLSTYFPWIWLNLQQQHRNKQNIKTHLWRLENNWDSKWKGGKTKMLFPAVWPSVELELILLYLGGLISFAQAALYENGSTILCNLFSKLFGNFSWLWENISPPIPL